MKTFFENVNFAVREKGRLIALRSEIQLNGGTIDEEAFEEREAGLWFSVLGPSLNWERENTGRLQPDFEEEYQKFIDASKPLGTQYVLADLGNANQMR